MNKGIVLALIFALSGCTTNYTREGRTMRVMCVLLCIVTERSHTWRAHNPRELYFPPGGFDDDEIEGR